MRLERIDSIFELEKGTLQSTKCDAGDFDFITASREWKTHKEFTHDKEALIIAVAASGSLGRTHYVDGKFIASDLCFILTPKGKHADKLSLPFYQFVFNGLKEDLVKKCATGTAKQAINQQNFSSYRIPCFEPDEQSRMALRLKTAFASQESLEIEISHQETLLAKLKQAILQEAIAGKLTADWRAAHPDVEPARQLLHRIQAERARLIAAKKLRPEKPLPKITPAEIPFEIPQGWEWCRLGELCTKVTDGFHNTPPKVGEGFPYIAATHVKSDGIDFTNAYLVEEKFHRELYAKTEPQRGEILVVNIGAGSGCPAIIDVDFEFSFKNTAILKFNQELLSNFYLFHYLRHVQRENYEMLTRGANQPFLSLKVIKEFVIPLPPLAEQAAIVARVEALMEHCRVLTAEIAHTRTHAAHLLQAVLKEAFAPARK